MIKKVTIDDLARMVTKGFAETKAEIASFRLEVSGWRSELMLADHKRRIERLELDMKELKNALAM